MSKEGSSRNFFDLDENETAPPSTSRSAPASTPASASTVASAPSSTPFPASASDKAPFPSSTSVSAAAPFPAAPSSPVQDLQPAVVSSNSVEASAQSSGITLTEKESAEWEKNIRDLRRYDLDDDDDLIAAELLSTPISDLVFVRIDGVPSANSALEQNESGEGTLAGSLEGAECEEGNIDDVVQSNSAALKPKFQVPTKRYVMEDALSSFNGSGNHFAFLVTSGPSGFTYHAGAALAPVSESKNEKSILQIQKSVFTSVYNGIHMSKNEIAHEDLRDLISPLATHVGLLTGIPSLKTSRLAFDQLANLASGIQGERCGILLLAAPIPQKTIMEEESIILDRIRAAEDKLKTSNNIRVKYFLELEQAYLQHVALGQSNGYWNVGAYFFASTLEVFLRLGGVIKTTFADDTSYPTPLRTHQLKGLREHLLSFGLLNNAREDSNGHLLHRHKLLSPLNSRALSAYVHLPGPGA